MKGEREQGGGTEGRPSLGRMVLCPASPLRTSIRGIWLRRVLAVRPFIRTHDLTCG